MLAGYRQLLVAGRRLQWDAGEIGLGADRRQWAAGDDRLRARLLPLLAGFWVAEHAVAAQLEPFIARASGDAEACFELQAGDERRHAEFFDRVLREVVEIDPDREARALAGEAIVDLFGRALPAMATSLAEDEVELADAVVFYHLVLEAIVLTVGQDALLQQIEGLPGIAAGVAHVQADERWHIGLGVTALAESDCALPEVLDPLARRAASAWGPSVATPRRVEWALAGHRRRTALLSRSSVAT